MSISSITDFLIPPITKYRLSEELGSGAYGVVYKGLREDDGKNIALKRIYITDKDGNNNIPLSTHRELCALKKLNSFENKNIVKLFDVILNNIDGKMCMDLIFELGDYDLEKYLNKCNSFGDMPLAKIIVLLNSLVSTLWTNEIPLMSIHIFTNLSKQLLDAIWFMHSHCVIHRDLKPANILINRDGTDLKVTDFGLARILGFDSSLTPVVVTLWYRSPEILLQRSYLTACDVWSAGCIIAEMVYGKPVFAGDNELSQIEIIVTRLGFEAIDNWPKDNVIVASSLRSLVDKSRSLEIVLKRADQMFIKLIKELLRFDPEKRILSNEAFKKLDALSRFYSRNDANGPNCSSSSNISTSSDANYNCKEWEIDCENEMIVKSVVSNVLDEEEGEQGELRIPGIDYNEPINCYPHGEIEIENGDESSLEDEIGTDSCSETESCDENGTVQEEQEGDLDTKEVDERGNSFNSYRSCQNNCSFSSQAPSSPAAIDTASDDERTECRYSHEITECKDKFNDTVIRDDRLPDSVGPIEITSSDEVTSDEEETCSASEPSPSILQTQSQRSVDKSLPFLMTRHNSDRIYSTPFKELNDSDRLLRSCSIPPKEQFVRKRFLHPEDTSDSENEFAHFSPIPSVEFKPNLFRQKSLRRRVSMLGPHLAGENKLKSSLMRSESVRIKPISENEELRDMSFGERSLTRELESIKSETNMKLSSQLSDRPKIVVRRRSTIVKK